MVGDETADLGEQSTGPLPAVLCPPILAEGFPSTRGDQVGVGGTGPVAGFGVASRGLFDKCEGALGAAPLVDVGQGGQGLAFEDPASDSPDEPQRFAGAADGLAGVAIALEPTSGDAGLDALFSSVGQRQTAPASWRPWP